MLHRIASAFERIVKGVRIAGLCCDLWPCPARRRRCWRRSSTEPGRLTVLVTDADTPPRLRRSPSSPSTACLAHDAMLVSSYIRAPWSTTSRRPCTRVARRGLWEFRPPAPLLVRFAVRRRVRRVVTRRPEPLATARASGQRLDRRPSRNLKGLARGNPSRTEGQMSRIRDAAAARECPPRARAGSLPLSAGDGMCRCGVGLARYIFSAYATVVPGG